MDDDMGKNQMTRRRLGGEYILELAKSNTQENAKLKNTRQR